jgi:6-phosphogluconate dehydrogenase
MQIAMIGLGRMGGNISRRLLKHGHDVVVYDHNQEAATALAKEKAKPARNLDDLVKQLSAPRTVWVMLPAGAPTESTVAELGKLLSEGDTIIDGGNSFYKDDIRRAKDLRARKIEYIDVGTSGGVWGVERGYCMMIGGDEKNVRRLDPIFSALAPGLGDIERTPGREGRDTRPEHGYLYAGPVGSGHFVKMIHNGIFDVLRSKSSTILPEDERYDLNLPDIAEVWRRGSVISSWLLDLTAIALAKSADLEGYTGFVDDSGEARWTVNAAIEEAVSVDVLAASLFARFRSRIERSFGEKLLSALRNQFGGHTEGQLEGGLKK